MIEVSFLRIDSHKDDYLKKILKECSGSIKVFSGYKDSLFKGPLIAQLNQENLNLIRDILEDRDEIIILAFDGRENIKLMNELKPYFSKIYGFLDLSLDFDYNIPLVKNYLNQNYSKHVVGIVKLGKDLDKILEFTQTELSRVKELHDRVVKMRTEELKAAKLLIKFMVGEKSGGEFFDYIEKDHEMILIEAGCDSYLMSSMIISEVENLKINSGNFTEHMKVFIKNILKSADEQKSKINFLVTKFNLNTLELEYYQRGNSKVYFDKHVHSLGGEGKLKLKRGEKLFFISEGAIRNWALHNKEVDLQNFLNKHSDLGTKDFLNEFFFELYRHKSSSFLIYDALMCAIEIDPNAIHEV